MPDINILFQPVRQYCRRDVSNCQTDDRPVNAATRMGDQRISSLVVCDGAKPLEIVTGENLHNKVVANGIYPHYLTVRIIMTNLQTAIERVHSFQETLEQRLWLGQSI